LDSHHCCHANQKPGDRPNHDISAAPPRADSPGATSAPTRKKRNIARKDASRSDRPTNIRMPIAAISARPWLTTSASSRNARLDPWARCGKKVPTDEASRMIHQCRPGVRSNAAVTIA
jgi:hypothetical protein